MSDFAFFGQPEDEVKGLLSNFTSVIANAADGFSDSQAAIFHIIAGEIGQ